MTSALRPTAKAVERLTTGSHPPDPRGILNALSRIGYSMAEAISDLLDNSVDAKADQVLIRLWHDGERLTEVSIVDNGRGMAESVLDEAMRFGAQVPHEEADLGKFGLGLKSATFSQARRLTVVSRQRGASSGRRWTVDGISAGWELERVAVEEIEQLLDRDWGPLAPRRQPFWNSGLLEPDLPV